jgi:hypothetical protein
MARQPGSFQIYSTAIPVAGWSGLIVMALAVILAVYLPAARLVLFIGVLGGAVIAAFAILSHRRAKRLKGPEIRR